ncbi:MAG: hypothetical protein P8L68_09905 [Paracoccaceae bacterium]|nr:hypothetical protein [Paracoccaceae bacterium]MDG2258792.1 hypothetical protein [Paracoccaceae bacterium]
MRKLLIAVVLVSGCTEMPATNQEISAASQGASFPKLIALEQQGTSDVGTLSDDVISELDGRTAGLWARIGSIFN